MAIVNTCSKQPPCAHIHFGAPAKTLKEKSFKYNDDDGYGGGDDGDVDGDGDDDVDADADGVLMGYDESGV